MTKKEPTKESTLEPVISESANLYHSLQRSVRCSQKALEIPGITAINTEECSTIVGIGTDGAAVNIAGAGLKGLVEEKLPWVFWS